MACGLFYIKGGSVREMEYTLNNMASSITGMICDGVNQGCTMKGVAACDVAFRSVEFAINGVNLTKSTENSVVKPNIRSGPHCSHCSVYKCYFRMISPIDREFISIT